MTPPKAAASRLLCMHGRRDAYRTCRCVTLTAPSSQARDNSIHWHAICPGPRFQLRRHH